MRVPFKPPSGAGWCETGACQSTRLGKSLPTHQASLQLKHRSPAYTSAVATPAFRATAAFELFRKLSYVVWFFEMSTAWKEESAKTNQNMMKQ